MEVYPVWRRGVAAMVLLGVCTIRLVAQNVLLTEVDGKLLPVRNVRQNRPVVEIDGKPVIASSTRYAFKKVAEYRPELVSVSNSEASTEYVNVVGEGEINHDFLFHATLQTPYMLSHVFVVVQLDTDEAGKTLFLQEVGVLEPGSPKTISVRVPMTTGLGHGHYILHVFAGGMEVMTTLMPAPLRDHYLEEIVFHRIAGVQDAKPELLSGPPPQYPPSHLKSGITGQVVIALRVRTNGQVYNPKVISETDAEFGDAALMAVRLWLFRPQVKNGRPTEVAVNLPIVFDPPGKHP